MTREERLEAARTRATYSDAMAAIDWLPLTDRDIYRWQAQDARDEIDRLEAEIETEREAQP